MRKIIQRIPLYQKRNIGEIINATFDFLKENKRLWFIGSTAILLPLCALMLMMESNVVDDITYDLYYLTLLTHISSALVENAFAVVVATVAMQLTGAWLWTMQDLYANQPERLRTLTVRQALTAWLPKAGKMLLAGIIIVSINLFISILLQSGQLFLTLIILLTVPPVLLIGPVICLEKVGVWDAFTKAFRLGYKEYFRLIGVLLCMTLIYIALQFSIYWVSVLVSLLFSTLFGSLSINHLPFWGAVIIQFLVLLMWYVSLMASSFLLLSMGYYYGDLAQKVDDASLENDIENFENL